MYSPISLITFLTVHHVHTLLIDEKRMKNRLHLQSWAFATFRDNATKTKNLVWRGSFKIASRCHYRQENVSLCHKWILNLRVHTVLASSYSGFFGVASVWRTKEGREWGEGSSWRSSRNKACGKFPRTLREGESKIWHVVAVTEGPNTLCRVPSTVQYICNSAPKKGK